MLRTLMCALVIGAFSFVVGCGNDPVKDMEKLADKMCACKDKACADKVEKEFEEIGKKYKDKKEKPSEDVMKKLMAASAKYAECQMKLTTGGDGDDGKVEPPKDEEEDKKDEEDKTE